MKEKIYKSQKLQKINKTKISNKTKNCNFNYKMLFSKTNKKELTRSQFKKIFQIPNLSKKFSKCENKN